MIYGDINSTLVGALTAAKLHILVAHVETGLRSFNRAMPEEMNRVMADHLSDVLFASTDAAVANLHHKGINSARIHKVGDMMYNAALFFAVRAKERMILTKLGVEPRHYVLCTLRRAENADDPKHVAMFVVALGSVAVCILVISPCIRAVAVRWRATG